MPIIAFGFRLKALMKRSFHLLGRVEYRERPLSPVILMNALPVRLWREINSDAVSRFFMLCILLRQDAVRGMDHSFFLADARSFYIHRVRLFRSGIFLIDQY